MDHKHDKHMADHKELSPRRKVTAEIRNRFIAGSVVITASIAAITAVIVVTAMNRMPVYGLWPVAIGGVVVIAALVWSYGYLRRRLFFAEYGVESVAVVVHVKEATRHTPRVVTFEYEYESVIRRSKRSDAYFKEGRSLPILIDPRDPSVWVRRDEILHDATPRPGGT